MGNSNGNIHKYWKEFWNQDHPRLQGGFVWDMVDQGIRSTKVSKICCIRRITKEIEYLILTVL